MKICILSMQRIPNFGSLLQSYSLKKILQNLGHEVAFIDIEKNEDDNSLRGREHHHYESESGYSRGLLTKFKKVDKYIINRIKIKILDRKQNKYFEIFRKKYLNIKEEDNLKHYDYCVIGSDEVFNCMTDSWWGFTSQLFGNVKQADRVITYAASCGATEAKQLPEKVRDKIEKIFQRVSGFSVRDENTKVFVGTLSKRTPELHLDPVMVSSLDNEIQNAQLPAGLPECYCIVYSYYNRIKSKKEIDVIKNFCKNHAMKIISVGSPQFWIKDHIVCSPFQMLRVFQNASFVVTDTFHGTIFSEKYAKKFAVIIRESNRNKLMDLVNRTGIEDHLLDRIENLSVVYAVEKNETSISLLVEDEIIRSKEYLKSHIV